MQSVTEQAWLRGLKVVELPLGEVWEKTEGGDTVYLEQRWCALLQNYPDIFCPKSSQV